MAAPLVEGVIANVFTVFNEDETLDDKGQRNFLDALIETRAVDAYFVRSGMGQIYTFEYDDVVQIARNACAHMAGKGPVLVGAAGIWNRNPDTRPDPEVFMQQAVDLSKLAEDLGAAGVVHTMPEAIAPTESRSALDISIEYFERISNAVKIPIFLYQPPGTNPAFHAKVDTIRRLMEIPGVCAIKISTTDAGYILDMAWAARGTNFRYISGAETAYFATLACGAKGVIGQGACLCPAILQAVKSRYESGDIDGAMDAQRSVNLLVEKTGDAVTFYKRYLNEKGYKMSSKARSTASNPYWKSPVPPTDEQYAAYKELLEYELARYDAVLPNRA